MQFQIMSFRSSSRRDLLHKADQEQTALLHTVGWWHMHFWAVAHYKSLSELLCSQKPHLSLAVAASNVRLRVDLYRKMISFDIRRLRYVISINM